MTVDSIRPSETPAPRPEGMWEHPCEHAGCAAWGSYGYTRGKSWPVQWYCHDHREDGERLIGRG